MKGIEQENRRIVSKQGSQKKSIKRIELHNLSVSYYLKLFDMI